MLDLNDAGEGQVNALREPTTPTFAISLFSDVFAKEITPVTGTLDDLAATIRTTTAPTKNQLPLLKLARFGNTPVPHTGSLRHDQNLLACSGVEGDYDAGEVSLDEAHERLLKANITAVICATPSYTPAAPKWRVLMPFSQELPPQDRSRMVDRLNGVLGGILAPESWTLSQSYYYGSVNSNPDHRVEIIEGEFIDQLDELDVIAVGKPNGGTGTKANGAGRAAGPVDEKALEQAIVNGDAYHESCTRLLGLWIRQSVAFDEAERRLFALFDQVDPAMRDARWEERHADVPRTVDGIYGKDARRQDDADAELNEIQLDITKLAECNSTEATKLTTKLIERIAAASLPTLVENKLVADIKRLSAIRPASVIDKALKEARSNLKAQRKEVAHPAASWDAMVKRNDQGEVRPTMANVAIILRNAPEFRDALWFDEFSDCIAIRKPLPTDDPTAFCERQWTDDDERAITEWVQDVAEMNVHKNTVFDAVIRVAKERVFHPVRDYLDSLQWDGVSRIDGLLTNYFRASEAPPEYLTAIGSRALIQAVARVFRPGVKADCMLLIDGDQGDRKSSALRMLFDPLDLGWFIDHIPDIDSKDAAIQLRGKWLLEFSELSALRKADSNRTKGFLSQTDDEYRPPYGRQRVRVKRQKTFAGTTNDDEVLKDPSGNRRYWPFKSGSINVDQIWADRHQIWAEAMHRYRNSEKWWINEPELKAIAEGEQAKYQKTDPWEDAIIDYIAVRPSVSVTEILKDALFITTDKHTQPMANRVADCLKRAKWVKKQIGAGTERGKRRYFPQKKLDVPNLSGYVR
jgi:predicted P-loop ATPase